MLKKSISFLLFVVASFLAIYPLGCSKAHAEPDIKLLSAPDIKPPVYGRLFNPSQAGKYPAIVILHGKEGPSARDYDGEARRLADKGYVVLFLHHYEEIGSISILGAKRRIGRWKKYQQTVRNAFEYLKGLPNVQQNNLGIIGHSMGAALALSTAGYIENVKAVISYYGAQPDGEIMVEKVGDSNPLSIAPADYLIKLPPVLILHGDADETIDVQDSISFCDRLREKNKICEMKIYPGESHNFSNEDAEQRVASFFSKYL